MTDTSLVILNPDTDLKALFVMSGETDPLAEMLKRIEAEVRAEHIDCETEDGRARAKSVAHSVSRAKTALIASAKELKKDAQATLNSVNAKIKPAEAQLDALRDEVKAPALAFEAKENERVEVIKAKITGMEVTDDVSRMPSDAIAALIVKIGAIDPKDGFEEYSDVAIEAKKLALERLASIKVDVDKREQEAIELHKLREEKAERDAEKAKAEMAVTEKATLMRRLDGIALPDDTSAASASPDLLRIIGRLDGMDLTEATWGDILPAAKVKQKQLIDLLEGMRSVAVERERLEAQEAQRDANERAAAKAKEDAIQAVLAEKQRKERLEADRKADADHNEAVTIEITNMIHALIEPCTDAGDAADAVVSALVSGEIAHTTVSF